MRNAGLLALALLPGLLATPARAEVPFHALATDRWCSDEGDGGGRGERHCEVREATWAAGAATTDVDASPNGGIDGFPAAVEERGVVRSFFVPKLCNHCANPPCVQVCPVGATFSTEDGVVLVDESYCIGCRYCIQACPYGARFLHPVSKTAQKCTFCYHRVVQGMVPACVEVCPTSARIFGEVHRPSSPLTRFRRFNAIQVLKAHLNTEPKVFYANLDGQVR